MCDWPPTFINEAIYSKTLSIVNIQDLSKFYHFYVNFIVETAFEGLKIDFIV